MNDIFDIINTRKSTREFNEEEVNLEDVKKILKSTLNVASSRNVQPLSYIVFTDKNKISKMAEFSGNQSQVNPFIYTNNCRFIKVNKCLEVIK